MAATASGPWREAKAALTSFLKAGLRAVSPRISPINRSGPSAASVSGDGVVRRTPFGRAGAFRRPCGGGSGVTRRARATMASIDASGSTRPSRPRRLLHDAGAGPIAALGGLVVPAAA